VAAIRPFCVVLLVLSAAAACSLNKPVAGADPSTATTGTVAGLVSTDAGRMPVSGRKVTATNTGTSARFDVTTAADGGYTLKVPAGHYSLDVELRTGERLDQRPDATDVGAGDLDSGRDFVIAK
jgi:hypothetical protein